MRRAPWWPAPPSLAGYVGGSSPASLLLRGCRRCVVDPRVDGAVDDVEEWLGRCGAVHHTARQSSADLTPVLRVRYSIILLLSSLRRRRRWPFSLYAPPIRCQATQRRGAYPPASLRGTMEAPNKRGDGTTPDLRTAIVTDSTCDIATCRAGNITVVRARVWGGRAARGWLSTRDGLRAPLSRALPPARPISSGDRTVPTGAGLYHLGVERHVQLGPSRRRRISRHARLRRTRGSPR